MRVLVVEDDRRMGDLVKQCLLDANFTVDLARDVETFIGYSEICRHDLYVIDLCLNDGDGLKLIRSFRGRGVETPVLITTARGTLGDRVAGFDCGADDYLVKPFHLQELIARARALVRRPAHMQARTLKIAALELDAETGDVACHARRLELRRNERRLLALMMQRAGKLVDREMIDAAVGDGTNPMSANAVEQLVFRLRRSLAPVKAGVEIRTARGDGWTLQPSQTVQVH